MSYDAWFDRRKFLTATGVVAVAGALDLPALAASETELTPDIFLGVEEVAGFAEFAERSGEHVLLMRRADDPVRFWQREIAPRLGAAPAVTGVTLWSDYIVFRGLAVEARLKVGTEIATRGRDSIFLPDTPLHLWRFARA